MAKAVLPFSGRLLDTATGLGYSVIEAAKYASEVITIELDPIATQMARRNPVSRELFTNPKIKRLIGNSAELIKAQPSESFGAVVHDPPAINLAGELYSGAFYAEVLRVLQRGGKMFHYVGDPNSASGGRTTKGVVRRLQDVGFKRVVPKPQAFGLLAFK
jgi:predicted methyltransferase